MSVNEQIKTVNPSVPPALFRLLMRDDSTAYLRDEHGIVGFEILPDSTPIEGFALIGMRKRTILAYRSEDKTPRLVIFPSMDKLFNHSFGLLSLKVKKLHFTSDNFKGKELGEGVLADLVRDLTPPEKNVELPDNLTEQMIRIMISDYTDQEEEDNVAAHATLDRFKPVGSEPDLSVVEDSRQSKSTPEFKPVNNPYFEDDSIPVLDETPKEPYDVVKDRVYTSEHDVIDFVVITYGVDRALLMKLLNALLLKTQGMSKEKRTEQYKLLVCKLLKENPSVVTKHD